MVHIYNFLPIFSAVFYREESTEQYDIFFSIANKGISCFGRLPKADITIKMGGGGGHNRKWLGLSSKLAQIVTQRCRGATCLIWPCSQVSRVDLHTIQRSVSGEL